MARRDDIPQQLLAELLGLPAAPRPIRSHALGRYMRVGVEYRALQAAGVHNIGPVIAKLHGVAPVGGRALIMRAREHGLIPDHEGDES